MDLNVLFFGDWRLHICFMKRFPVSHAHELLFNKLNEKLPLFFYSEVETIAISGEDLLLAGWKNIMDHKPDPNITYNIGVNNPRLRNHVRAMRQAYTKDGDDGLLKYLEIFLTPTDIGLVKSVLPELC